MEALREIEKIKTFFPLPQNENRKTTAMHIANQCLLFLKSSPLYSKSNEGNFIEIGLNALNSLLSNLEHPSGRRYVLWSIIYLCSGLFFDPQFQQRSRETVLKALNTFLQRWNDWTTKERRVIVRGACLMAQKVGESGIFVQEKDVRSFFENLIIYVIKKEELKFPIYYYTGILFKRLMYYGIISQGFLFNLISLVSHMREIIDDGLEGMLERFIDAPSTLDVFTFKSMASQTHIYQIFEEKLYNIVSEQLTHRLKIEKFNKNHIEVLLKDSFLTKLFIQTVKFRVKETLTSSDRFKLYKLDYEDAIKLKEVVNEYLKDKKTKLSIEKQKILQEIIDLLNPVIETNSK